MLCTKCDEESVIDFGENERYCQLHWEEVCSDDWWKGVDEGWIF
jgi:hypothetical protein